MNRKTLTLLAILAALLVGLAQPAYGQCQASGYGVVSMTAYVPDGGYSLRGDGKGLYVDQRDNVNVNLSEAGTIRTFRPIQRPYRKIRSLVFDLNNPAPDPVNHVSSVARGTIQDSDAEFHALYKLDPVDPATGLRQIHSIQEIAEGQTVTSQRTEMLVHIKGAPYLLVFGDQWPKNTCFPSAGALVSGPGTTAATITRRGGQLEVTVPVGSLGRLFNYKNTQKPIDLGLYVFDFFVSFAP